MNRWYNLGVSLLLASSVAVASGARDASAHLGLHFSHLGIEQGLSSGAIADTLQDRNGFIWLATQDGLNRYDGSRVEVFRHRGNDEHSLIGNNSRVLHEDSDGYIWVGSRDKGLSRLQPETRRVDRFGATEGLRSLAVRALVSDAEYVWVATRGGLHRVSRQSLSVEAIDIAGVDAINAMVIDRGGQLWLGTDKSGIVRLDKDGSVSGVIAADQIGAPVTALVLDAAEGDIWVGSEGRGLLAVNLLRQTVGKLTTRNGLAHNHISDLLRIGPHLWVATWGGGLQRLNLESQQLETVNFAPGTPGALNHHTISSLFEDRSGVLWVGTWGRGVNLHHRYGPRFQTFRHDVDRPDSLSPSSVNFMRVRGQHELLVGTWGSGLDVLDRRTGAVTHYPADPLELTAPHNGRFYALLPIGADSYWIGTDDGISVLDARTMRFTRFGIPEGATDTLKNHRVRTLLRDTRGHVWIGTESRGLQRFDPATGKFTVFKHHLSQPGSLSHNRVMALYEDRRRRLWVGTFGGVNRLDPGKAQFVHYRAGSAAEGGLSSDAILTFYEDAESNMWIGTKYGLNRLNVESGEVRHYMSTGGLPNDVVYGILPDDESRLWLSTNRGLARFDPRTGRSVNYHRSDGIQAEEFNAGAYYRSESGEIFFGGTEGFTSLLPGLILDNPHPPQVQIVDIRVVNSEATGSGFERLATLGQRAPYTFEDIRLGWRDFMVQFHFAALHFADPTGNRIAYRLLGLDDEWIEVDGSLPIATFSNLRPGTYTLEVKAANSDGVWHSEPRQLHITVAPPPWQTPWAYVGYACLILLAILVSLWFFRRKLAKEREINEQLRLADEQLTQANAGLEAQVRGRTQALRRANRALEELSLTDALTGVRNRRFFTERVIPELDELIEGRLQGGKREEDQLGAVCFMIDIDKFKKLNDGYGHAVGDDLITEFAILLEEQFRQNDHVIRWGGEEFLVLTRLRTNVDPRKVAERLRGAVAKHEFCTDRGALSLTCSIGFARLPFLPTQPDAFTIYEVIELADQCLYHAKQRGRNRWCGAFAKRGLDPEVLKDKLRNADDAALDTPNLGITLSPTKERGATTSERAETA